METKIDHIKIEEDRIRKAIPELDDLYWNMDYSDEHLGWHRIDIYPNKFASIDEVKINKLRSLGYSLFYMAINTVSSNKKLKNKAYAVFHRKYMSYGNTEGD